MMFDDEKKQELKAAFFLGRASARVDQILHETDDDDTEAQVVVLNAKADLYNFTHWFLGLLPEPPITE